MQLYDISNNRAHLLCFTDAGGEPQEETHSTSSQFVATWDLIPGGQPISLISLPVNRPIKRLDDFGNVGDGENNTATSHFSSFCYGFIKARI